MLGGDTIRSMRRQLHELRAELRAAMEAWESAAAHVARVKSRGAVTLPMSVYRREVEARTAVKDAQLKLALARSTALDPQR